MAARLHLRLGVVGGMGTPARRAEHSRAARACPAGWWDVSPGPRWPLTDRCQHSLQAGPRVRGGMEPPLTLWTPWVWTDLR